MLIEFLSVPELCLLYRNHRFHYIYLQHFPNHFKILIIFPFKVFTFLRIQSNEPEQKKFHVSIDHIIVIILFALYSDAFFYLSEFLSFFCQILFYHHATIFTPVLYIIFKFIIVRITFASARVYLVSHRSDPPRPYRLVVSEVNDDTSSIVSMLSSS